MPALNVGPIFKKIPDATQKKCISVVLLSAVWSSLVEDFHPSKWWRPPEYFFLGGNLIHHLAWPSVTLSVRTSRGPLSASEYDNPLSQQTDDLAEQFENIHIKWNNHSYDSVPLSMCEDEAPFWSAGNWLVVVRLRQRVQQMKRRTRKRCVTADNTFASFYCWLLFRNESTAKGKLTKELFVFYGRPQLMRN